MDNLLMLVFFAYLVVVIAVAIVSYRAWFERDGPIIGSIYALAFGTLVGIGMILLPIFASARW